MVKTMGIRVTQDKDMVYVMCSNNKPEQLGGAPHRTTLYHSTVP